MLTLFGILLLIAILLALILSAIRLPVKWLRWWPVVLALATVLHLLVDGYYQTFIWIYAFAVILIALGLYRFNKEADSPPSDRRTLRIGWAVLWRLTVAASIFPTVVLSLIIGSSDVLLPMMLQSYNADYSELGWRAAFDAMHADFSRTYAFGGWKEIDWDALHDEFAPRIAAAEQTNDQTAYYLALREYVYLIPDGHVWLKGNDQGLREEMIGGEYGFAVIQLDDGRVIASLVAPDGPAEQAGMDWGAEIVTWNDLPIEQALKQTSTIWHHHAQATQEGYNIRQQNYLTRAPVGTAVTVTFRNPGETDTQEVTLTAVDDQMELLDRSMDMGLPLPREYGELSIADKPVESTILPEGYGYLRINYEPGPFMFNSWDHVNPVGAVRRAVADFIEADVPGVVIDVRGNLGGMDQVVPLMMAYFVEQSMLYEQIAYVDKKTGEFDFVGDIALEPTNRTYTDPVALLIDHETNSSGEGFPLIVQSLQRGPVVGFYGTSASFGMTGAGIKMPGGYEVRYPNGASFDEDGVIQGDSNHLMQGSFVPDVRIPLTEETVRAMYVDGRDVVLETAVTLLETMTNNGENR